MWSYFRHSKCIRSKDIHKTLSMLIWCLVSMWSFRFSGAYKRCLKDVFTTPFCLLEAMVMKMETDLWQFLSVFYGKRSLILAQHQQIDWFLSKRLIDWPTDSILYIKDLFFFDIFRLDGLWLSLTYITIIFRGLIATSGMSSALETQRSWVRVSFQRIQYRLVALDLPKPEMSLISFILLYVIYGCLKDNVRNVMLLLLGVKHTRIILTILLIY